MIDWLHRAAARLRPAAPAEPAIGNERLRPGENIVAASLEASKPAPPAPQPASTARRRGWLLPVINLTTTALASLAVIVASLSYTGTTIGRLAGEPEVNTSNLRTPKPPPESVTVITPSREAGTAAASPAAEAPAVEVPTPSAPQPEAPPAAMLPPEPATVEPSPEAPPGQQGDLRTVNMAVTLRSGPSVDAEPIGTLSAGTEVEALGEMGGWIRVATPDRRAGWVYQRFLDGGAVAPLQ